MVALYAAKLIGHVAGERLDKKYFGGKAGAAKELVNKAIFYERLRRALLEVHRRHNPGAAEKIAEELRNNVPVDTGKLRDSVRVETDEKGSRVIEGGTPETLKRMKSGGEFDQALAIEYGTRKMTAQPHYWPTMRANEKSIEASLRDAIEEEFE